MKLKLKQNSKWFGNVDFSLINMNGESLGNIAITAKRTYYSISAMVQINGKKAIIKPIRLLDSIMNNPYREVVLRPIKPFRITGYYSEGWMFEKDTKLVTNNRFVLQRMFLDTGSYVMYKAGFGKEGMTCAVYKDDTKIATVHQPSKIINDVYDFDMDVDEGYLMEATLMVLQWYLGHYHTFNQMIKSVSVSNITTRDEFVLSKVM
ncbi:hypothetical protein [Butyrivibrio sp. NC2002]|uniref:hypothetical protein n=1 Tax=Butyrivibrio sp. NC2002 TaxID=1410610 RepID=UPI00055F73D9|nr:hypothetical protein [Butyrivibrio sp. NC2002]